MKKTIIITAMLILLLGLVSAITSNVYVNENHQDNNITNITFIEASDWSDVDTYSVGDTSLILTSKAFTLNKTENNATIDARPVLGSQLESLFSNAVGMLYREGVGSYFTLAFGSQFATDATDLLLAVGGVLASNLNLTDITLTTFTNDADFLTETEINTTIDTRGNNSYLRLDATNEPLTSNFGLNQSNFASEVYNTQKNTNGFARFVVNHTDGPEIGMVAFGNGFPDTTGNVNGSVGLGASNNTNMFFLVRGDGKYIWGRSDTGIDGDENFTMELDGNVLLLKGNLTLEDEDKIIRTGVVDGGSAMIFQSNEALTAGGFPFVWFAQDSDGNLIVPYWLQNGQNNSFSGQMNSFVTIPKNWLVETGMGTDNLSWMFNASNYPQLCSWLQTNLSLVPEGCKYFADTEGRGVPLMATGDGEFWRTITVHEFTTLFGGFQYVTRDGTNFEIFNGSVHNFIPTTFVTGFSAGESVPIFTERFTGSLGEFTNQQSDIGNWISNPSALCNNSPCAMASGAGVGVIEMLANFATININETQITFTYSMVGLTGGSSFAAEINGTQIFIDTGTDALITTTVDLNESFSNLASINLSFICTAANALQLCYVDDVIVNGTASVDTNQTVNGFNSEFLLGDGSNRIFWNDSSQTLELPGNTTFISTTIGTQNVTGDSTIGGDLSVGGDATIDGTTTSAEFNGALNWTFLQNYPTTCSGGTPNVQAVGDTLTCRADDDTQYTVSGILLNQTGTEIGLREGTLTDERVCEYEATGTQLECNTIKDTSGSCASGSLCTGDNTYPASKVTTGTFGAGDYSFPDDVNMTDGNVTDVVCLKFANGAQVGACG